MKLLKHIPRSLVLLLLAFVAFYDQSRAQSLYFPPVTGNSWDTISPSSLGWCTTEADTLFDYLETTNTKAFIVLKDGKIAIEWYFGTFTVDSLWYWASAGKSLTAFLVGIAKQEGFLDIEDTSSQYLGTGWTVCPSAKEEKITIRSQLTMTTGLDDGVADPYCTDDTCLQYLADAGSRWAYHNGPYTLLDEVMQTATGQTLNSYVFQKLSLTTGISGLFVPSGYNNVFISNARSMARFGLLALAEGQWNGAQILSDTGYFNQMVNTSQTLNQSYGYLWWLNGKASFMVPGLQLVFPGSFSPDAPADMVAALGKNGQLINVVPSQNLVMIRMGDAPGTGEVPFTYNDSVWVYLNRVLCSSTGLISHEPASSSGFYPNPVSDQLNLQGLNGDPVEYSIFSIDGRMVCTGMTRGSVAVYHLNPGMYIIQFKGDPHPNRSTFIKK